MRKNSGLSGNDLAIHRPPLIRFVAWVMLALLSATAAAALWALAARGPTRLPPEIGELAEPAYRRPSHVAQVEMSNVTHEWGLSEIDLGGGRDLDGGLGLVDIDGDGQLDLLAANGRAVAVKWEGTRFADSFDLGVDDAASIAGRDLDGDHRVDIVLARTSAPGLIVWAAGEVFSGSSEVVTADVGPVGASSLFPVDLDADGRPELLRLSREPGSSTDIILTLDGADRQTWSTEVLPNSDGLSLAIAVADIDGDGSLDVWITRDVGWDKGGDGLYSRASNGSNWVDVSTLMGVALAIDGMGIALLDMNGDETLDAYISDIGDNEVLARLGPKFVRQDGTGAARIRPPGASPSVVSSSWGVAVTDLNLDGRSDLVVAGGGFPNSSVRNKIPGTKVAEAEPPALFLGLGGGRFADDWPSTALSLNLTGRSTVVGDIDDDGDPDLLFLTRDGRIHALRNESGAPSLTIHVDESCGDGVVLSVTSPKTSHSVVVPAHTYGGQHPRQVIVGTRGAEVLVSLRPPGQAEQTVLVPARDERSRLAMEC